MIQVDALELRSNCPSACNESLGGLALVGGLDEINLGLAHANNMESQCRDNGVNLMLF